WIGLAGDSEWALRTPSALAGAAAVVAIYLAAREIRPLTSYPLLAALLFAVSPFALWYAQDAKVYSLLLLVVALELWALLRALRRGGRAGLPALAMAIVSVFVHRLALLVAAASALAYLIIWPAADRRPPTADQQSTTSGEGPAPSDEALRNTHYA